MSDDYLVRNAAPTLAGIKTGSLFTCPCTNRQTLIQWARGLNRKLRHKGLRILPLRFSSSKALIYLYRPGQLARDLSGQEAAGILTGCGYEAPCHGDCSRCLAKLARRLQERQEFPHEIGLFLGYPPEDVQGFMENKACHSKCVGCWKVYGDEEAAKRKFAQYKKCTRLYCDRWASGQDVEGLAVAM